VARRADCRRTNDDSGFVDSGTARRTFRELMLLSFGQLLLQIINKVLRAFLCQKFARLVRHVSVLAERLKFVSL
jgi:hypothetical protein